MTRLSALAPAIIALAAVVDGSVGLTRTSSQSGAVGDIEDVVVAKSNATEERMNAAARAAPKISLIGADAEQAAEFNEAVARFVGNRLDLPNLEVRFFADDTECYGHMGLFVRTSTPWQVLICSELAFVSTHELAHAWAAANLVDADRDRYLEARHLAVWTDSETPWKDRGVEDAAFVIQQNLMAEDVSIESPTWSERIEAYEALTGQVSPLLQPAA